METAILKAIKMTKIQLVSWIFVLTGAFISISLDSVIWAIIIISGYAFQIIGAVYIYVISNRGYGRKLLYYNIFMCICIMILILISMKIIPTTNDNDAEYAIIYGSIFLVFLLYFFSIFFIFQLNSQLKDL